MNLLYFMTLKLRQKMQLNLLVFVEVLLAILLLIYVCGSVQFYYDPISKLREIDTGKKEVFYVAQSYQEDRSVYTQLHSYLKKEHPEIKIGSTHDSFTVMPADGMSDDARKKLEKYADAETVKDWRGKEIFVASTMLYDEVTAEALRLPLHSGRQLTEGADKGAIPVLLRNAYKDVFSLGDTFKLDLFWESEVLQDDENGRTALYHNYRTLTVQVVGFLNSDDSFYDLRTMGTNSSAANFIRKNFDETMIMLRTEDGPISDLPQEKLSGAGMPYGYLLDFSKVSAEEKVECMQYFETYGTFLPFEKTVANSIQEFKVMAVEPTALLVLFFLVAVISICTINELMHISQKKDFSIYYICGSRWSTCLWIDLLRSAVLIFVPYAVACVASVFLLRNLESIRITPITYLIAFGGAALIYLVSTLWFNIRLIKTKPITYIRELE